MIFTFDAGSGGTVYLGIKFDASSVKGFPAPSPSPVHYTFETAGQPSSTQRLDLEQK